MGLTIYDFLEESDSTSDNDWDKEYQISRERTIKELKESISRIEEKTVAPNWTELQPLGEKLRGVGKSKGCYMVIHRPANGTEEYIFDVGEGNISSRRYRLVEIFNNHGEAKISPNAKVATDSSPAKKMYKKDPNINNWYFTWCKTGDKNLASGFEKILISRIQPEGNTQHMAGVN
jgi:hypothetical protein